MVAIYFVCVLITADIVAGSDWRYQDEGHWAALCQTGSKQSPIPLSKSIAEEADFSPYSLFGYGRETAILVKNNGHSAEVRLKVRDPIPEISGGGLPNVFQLDHLHFHWQSEHTIDRYRFPLELHLVHYDKKWANLQEGLKHPGGVAVFAVLFDLSPDSDQDLDPLLNKITSLVTKLNEPDEIDGFVIKNYLPRDLAGYYRYDGSLTTPNCTEGIIWTVLTNTIPISKEQVKVFENMRTDDDSVLKETFRSLQEINDRKVLHKVSPVRNMPDSAVTTSISAVTLLLGSLCIYSNH
ncbi:putative carbonic anhydrase 3 [Diabrotica virgifera virgifera]|uniref:Carbonic anhydrase n=1 Tax=Diabrotica virgifera virgifera TaxID=50390 RepID=A0A6P7FX11_DIAVI|nr:putative carbonic anhydrase 3 [Diabrotica virgifera virgifera]